MPTYEYVCSRCKNAWEEVQKISEPAVQVCPKCKKKTAQRQISGGSFILKGGGWYADLYSSPGKGTKKDGGGESKEAAKDSGKDSGTGKTETKTETKAETKSEAPAKKESSPPPSTSGTKS